MEYFQKIFDSIKEISPVLKRIKHVLYMLASVLKTIKAQEAFVVSEILCVLSLMFLMFLSILIWWLIGKCIKKINYGWHDEIGFLVDEWCEGILCFIIPYEDAGTSGFIENNFEYIIESCTISELSGIAKYKDFNEILYDTPRYKITCQRGSNGYFVLRAYADNKKETAFLVFGLEDFKKDE